MSVNPEEINELRVLTPAELALFVKTRRSQLKWSQATLAELAGVTERTIQRVEKGEPSDLDTRRGLARAFQCEDLDVFNKPWPFPNIEKLKARSAELEKTTVGVPITRIEDARTLRTMWELANSSMADELGKLSTAARQAFASIVDYLRGYGDICEEYSMTQRLEVDRDLDALLQGIADEGAVVGAGLRDGRFKFYAANVEPLYLKTIYVVLAPKNALPLNVRVPKVIPDSLV
jgi:transcriptional regulator with XRE-family HTH domain